MPLGPIAAAAAVRVCKAPVASGLAREGYDICPGPACQAYKGFAAEHELSTRAVRETNSEIGPIRKGDWVLIDLWARFPGDENIYSDITWVGCLTDTD